MSVGGTAQIAAVCAMVSNAVLVHHQLLSAWYTVISIHPATHTAQSGVLSPGSMCGRCTVITADNDKDVCAGQRHVLTTASMRVLHNQL
jgi:hypothetical protein